MSDADRPNPDALLSSIQREETASARGTLKVFLGMSPGVGKTYAMLEAAQRELIAGRDLVVGYVETHGRKEPIYGSRFRVAYDDKAVYVAVTAAEKNPQTLPRLGTSRLSSGATAPVV